MSARKRTAKALALLIPAGVLGISTALATVQAHAETTTQDLSSRTTVADRLSDLRQTVSSIHADVLKSAAPEQKVLLAEWLNIGGLGWRNGGWGNGGWHNGGWGNGGWGNGGWHNWHNFWHNW